MLKIAFKIMRNVIAKKTDTPFDVHDTQNVIYILLSAIQINDEQIADTLMNQTIFVVY